MDWTEFLTPRDREVFARSGWGGRGGFGRRPAIVVVDVNYKFCGDRREPILDSIERWCTSCGEEAWDALPRLRRLVDAAHAREVPVIYTTGTDYRPDGFDAGRWRDKNGRLRGDEIEAVDPRPPGNAIMPDIAPSERDIVISKGKPSAFFGTLLQAHLTNLRADSLIVCGTTTSGCVRATAVDGFSHNYRVAVVADCTFDRGQASHHMSLFDLDQKYADVVSLDETLDYLEGLPSGLFAEEFPAPV